MSYTIAEKHFRMIMADLEPGKGHDDQLRVLIRALALATGPAIGSETPSAGEHTEAEEIVKRWAKEPTSVPPMGNVTIVVQVNGHKRGEVWVAPGATEEEVTALATKDWTITKHLTGKARRKVVYVQDRLLNFICG